MKNVYICTIKTKKLEAMTVLSQSALGDCCWAAFLKDGALRENSPNYTGPYRD